MKIVLTGGPCAGKTEICLALREAFPKKLHYVPEVATLLFSGGFPRNNDSKSIVHRQKAIYFVQRELEAIHQMQMEAPVLLCDRGSMDGPAYWPEDATVPFYQAVGTTESEEVKRYEWVIHLETVHKEEYLRDDRIRTERYDHALKVNKEIMAAWSEHPQRVIVPSQEKFEDKLDACVKVFDAILGGMKHPEVLKLTK